MKINTVCRAIVSLAAIAVLAMGTSAFADRGTGCQGKHHGCGIYAKHHGKGGCPHGQMNADLTPEQREQLATERQAFFDATKTARQDLYAKQLELRAEIARSEPDLNKASALQKEVSDLQASLDQQRLKHIMAMRKINPAAGRGMMMEGREMEMGHHGMGYGMGGGSGNCPNR